MNSSWKHLVLAAGFALGCLQPVLAIDANSLSNVPSVLEEKVSPAISANFDVIGNAKGGMYQKICGNLPGGSLSIALERKTTVINAGGIYVEGNPTFTVTGDVVGKKLDLKVVPEDLISDMGGIMVQTGTIYHVKGTLAGQKIDADLKDDETITDCGGFKAVTERWATFKSHEKKGPAFELRRISVIADVGGFKVEQDSYNTWKGADKTGTSDFTIRNWVNREDTITVSGKGSIESLALLLALRPFLNI
ncbi:MAG: hypothetical protein WA705_25000 [Candidatus Ozemobacteraceae bacterium]